MSQPMANEQKEQEIVLPPLDEDCLRQLDEIGNSPSNQSLSDELWRTRYILLCRERQLLAALRDLAAAREQIAQLTQRETQAFNDGVKEAAAQFNACRSHCGYDSNVGIQRWLDWAHSEMLALKRPTQQEGEQHG